METKAGVDLWSKIIASEEQEGTDKNPESKSSIGGENLKTIHQDAFLMQVDLSDLNRVSLAGAIKRVYVLLPGKVAESPSSEKEREFSQEVDAF